MCTLCKVVKHVPNKKATLFQQSKEGMGILKSQDIYNTDQLNVYIQIEKG